MAVTDLDVSALEHLAYRIREDTHGIKPWDRQGTHVIFVRELKGKHLLTAIETVVAHASDPEAKTPAAITRPFLPAVQRAAASRAKQPGPDDRCTTCSKTKDLCQAVPFPDHEFESETAAKARAGGPRPRPGEVQP